MDDDDSGGLFNIEPSSSSSADETTPKVPRNFQSEADFQRQRAEWTPKSEVGEIWKTLKLPIDNPTKQQAQTIMHAIEELYFFGRYAEAGRVAEEVLRGELGGEFRRIVEGYRGRCVDKAGGAAKK